MYAFITTFCCCSRWAGSFAHPGTSAAAPRRVAALLTALAMTLVGCATRLNPPPAPPSASEYRVGAPDQLLISILPEPTIERTVTVRPDGMISVDLIGDIQAAGRTVEEIAREVEGRVARYKRGATVTVSIVAAASTAITVLGEVGAQSTFPLVKETRVVEAMGQVGGATFFGNTDSIRVVRSRGGETVVFDVDLDAISKGDLRTNIVLAGGDIVYVPPTLWARIGYVFQAMLFPFQPLIGLGTSVAGTAIAR